MAASGCASRTVLPLVAIPANPPITEKIQAKVAVVMPPGRRLVAGRRHEVISLGEVLLAAYPHQVTQMLGEIYQTVELRPYNSPGVADYVVTLSSDYPKVIGMSVQSPATGQELARFFYQGASWRIDESLGFAGYVLGGFVVVGTFGIGALLANHNAEVQSRILQAEIRNATVGALSAIRQSWVATDALMTAPARFSEIAAAEAAGDHAAGSGRYAEAQSAYIRGLSAAYPGGDSALRLQEKAVEIARSIAERPAVPEDAKEFMAKGKAAAALARAPVDFHAAALSMEKALAHAPWWANGHFNAALAHEGAGNWKAAARHMRSYMSLQPGSEDRETVRLKIAELELRHERRDPPVGAKN